jgi:hypothetical protein
MVVGIAGAPAHFEIGRVISRTFDVIGKNPVTFFGLSLLLSIPYWIFTFYSVLLVYFGIGSQTLASGALTQPGALSTVVAAGAVGFLIYFIFYNLLQAAITHGTIVSLNGGKASFGDCFSTGIKNVVPLTAIVILAGLGIMAGCLLLIVPGIILALMWSVITPVRVAEQTGVMETLSRSSSLTRGYKGSIFGIFVIFVVLSIVADLIIRPLSGVSMFGNAATANASITFMVLTGLVRAVLGLIDAAGVASIYYELRMVKEGVGPEQLAAVFA